MKTERQEQIYSNQIAITMPSEHIHSALHYVHGLTLLRGVLAHRAGQAVLHLGRTLTASPSDPKMIADAYSDAFYQLATASYEDTAVHISDAWQAYIIARLIDDSNIWSKQVESQGVTHVSSTLRAQARRDLQALQHLFELNAQSIWEHTHATVTKEMPTLKHAWVPWLDLHTKPDDKNSPAFNALVQTIAQCKDWIELVTPLEQYWSRYGTGPLARYHILRWQGTQKRLEGIEHPDPIKLTNLIGQERQQPRIIANVERFMAGLPTHNMFLYGPPGTGKSSTIKAIANAYADKGLCLVEVSKEDLSDLPQIVAHLRGHAPHYLLFIDDLSFEEHETSYKILKVLLEGTAETRPANVLVCATSNRMNLVKENFSERGKPTDDVNWRDSMDEKQSLVHRFGLRIHFFTPDQRQYLRIVNELAQQRGLDLSEEEVQVKALSWERQHAGRSGRSARQFIDDLEAELKYKQPARGEELEQ